MPVRACRVCGRAAFDEPLLRYEDMPAAAQELPRAEDLSRDAGVDLEVLQCASCGLVQLAGEPVPYYRDVIRAAAVSDDLRRAKTEQFAAFVADHGLRGKRVLEVGCGRGEFLSLLAPLGVEAFGLEHAPESVAACHERGLRVSRGYPGEGATPLEHAPFGAFLLLMFLEHIPDPGAALRAVRESLDDDGVGLIEVPNLDLVLRAGLFSEFIADHLLYFTAATLRTTLELNGFAVADLGETRDGYVLTASVEKRGRADVSGFGARRRRLSEDLRAFVAGIGPRGVAVWGAGHQAFALLALSGVAGGVRYVVDSAPFKQGRYTPATHVPIVAPDALETDPVDAVLIMAASYSDEVARIVRERFDPGLAVAVVREHGLEVV